MASLKFLMSQNIPTNFGFNYWYASTRYVLSTFPFSAIIELLFYCLSSSMLMFLQFICNSICRILEANYKDESRGCPKLFTFGAGAFDQTSILFCISLIIDLKSLYKHQFRCLSSRSFFSLNEKKCLSRPEEAIKA